MLSLKFKEFLLSGPPSKQLDLEDVSAMEADATDDRQALSNIKSQSIELLNEWSKYEAEEAVVNSGLQNVLSDIAEVRRQIDDESLSMKIREYSSLQNQVQLLQLAKVLSELQLFTDVRQIPGMMQDLMSALPDHLQKDSAIHKKIIKIVTTMKDSLLKSFHADFNSHLQNNEGSTDAKEMWSNFLIVARDWLMAYALISLLPTLISDSRSQILEKYTEALDEALTPLWGRFHFHLTSARESKSFEQFVWTFSYAKSFVSLLINLCTQLTSSGQLQNLDHGDFKSSALQHITEKAVRFMRAHLAQAIVDASPMSDTDCMRLVESTLEFDHALSQTFLPSMSVSAVLYDARLLHAQWVRADHHFFTAYLSDACKDDAAIFSYRQPFSSSKAYYAEASSVASLADDGVCYKAVYDCLYVFLLGLQRYNLLPRGSQEIFSRVILEPLLSIGVGLFLYRIRSCPILYPISTGLLPLQSISDKSVRSSHFSNGSTNGSRNVLLELTVPRELVEFKASVEYFQSCLENIPKGSRGFSGSVMRYQESWKAARGDFPDDLIKDRLKDDGYSVVDVIKNIMFLSYPGDSDDLKEKERERERQASAEVAGPDDLSIGGVVDYARTQVLKMSSVLETQWAKLQ